MEGRDPRTHVTPECYYDPGYYYISCLRSTQSEVTQVRQIGALLEWDLDWNHVFRDPSRDGPWPQEFWAWAKFRFSHIGGYESQEITHSEEGPGH